MSHSISIRRTSTAERKTNNSLTLQRCEREITKIIVVVAVKRGEKRYKIQEKISNQLLKYDNTLVVYVEWKKFSLFEIVYFELL